MKHPTISDASTRRQFLQQATMAATSAFFSPALSFAAQPGRQLPDNNARQTRERFVALAESLKPQLHETPQKPLSLVRAVADPAKYLRWRMEPEAPGADLNHRLLHKGDSFILDFGGHRTGRLSFRLIGEGKSIDAPTHLRFVFGEVPGDVAEPLYPYKGQLSSSWLPEEIIHVDFLPQQVNMPRRYAFRYVKVEVLDTSPNYGVRFEDVQATALSSASAMPADLKASTPEWIRRVDEVSLATLRDCMQTTFEDGPRRDQRLWIGDLRLQAQANYVTFRNMDLVKRCLYLFAGLPRADGFLPACVFEKPSPVTTDTFILDYAVLYGAAVLDYVNATHDQQVAQDLWPVVRRQLEIAGQTIGPDGLFVDRKTTWVFIDWNTALERTAAMQGVFLYGYQRALQLARLAGRESEAADYPERIQRMTAAAHKAFYDPARKVCVSGPDRQVSWASQAWLVLGGVLSREEGGEALRRAVLQDQAATRPTTAYLYHHVVDAFLECGLKNEAMDLIRSYWGGMVNDGADTFWEAFDPADSRFSPYGDVHINSFCHAWSCTPTYFFRARGLA